MVIAISALDRKLLRDIWRTKGQALAIAAVIAAGVAMYVAYLSTFHSLRHTQHAYYERHDFADLFATMKRAPLGLRARVAAVPGVARAEARVVVDVTLHVEGLDAPATGRLISLADDPDGALNGVELVRGRRPSPQRLDEVLVSEGFALARRVGPGDSIGAVINGRLRDLEIVGIALSPEYIYSIRPGDIIPDDGRFGIFWMPRPALAAAYDMEGGFNDLSIILEPGASEPEVQSRVRELLRPYGGTTVLPRAQQQSHWYLENELMGLQGAGFIIPAIFLGVAAFLLNAVLSRLVQLQRDQVAALKALGYSGLSIGLHYAKWCLAVALLGTLLGLAGGAWMGSAMTTLYNDYFRFPTLLYQLTPRTILGAVTVSLIAAALGSVGSVRRVLRLPPAEAMRPEPPARYRQGFWEGIGLAQGLTPPARMILRNLGRRPARTFSSILGIAFAVALLIVGTFSLDSLDVLMDVQFSQLQRQDATVLFTEAAAPRARYEIQRLPGLLSSEPMRAVAVRLVSGHRSREVAIMGIPPEPELQRVLDGDFRPVRVPEDGLLLSRKLGEILDIGPGEELTVEVLEGSRPVRRVVVAALIDEFVGVSAYMAAPALHQLLREGSVLSGAYVMVDEANASDLYARLKAIPGVAGVTITRAALKGFQETIAANIGVMIFFNVLFSGIIAFGVVYNAARIALSERSRELASLRVMGFTRTEISTILLGELGVLTAGAIPLGLLLGYGLAAFTVMAYDTELYRFPLVITARTYGFAAVTVALASFVSSLLVRRKLDHLDLIAVLKTRE